MTNEERLYRLAMNEIESLRKELGAVKSELLSLKEESKTKKNNLIKNNSNELEGKEPGAKK